MTDPVNPLDGSPKSIDVSLVDVRLILSKHCPPSQP